MYRFHYGKKETAEILALNQIDENIARDLTFYNLGLAK